ncbi:MAG: hypothetical protein LBU64_11050 [Planctomycetota bacterium]|nr:hypothetical protein [Planctomycetota bacterium]
MFGVNILAKQALVQLRSLQIEVAGFVENREKFIHEMVGDLKVYSPEEARENFENPIIVGFGRTKRSNESLTRQCEKNHLEYYSYLGDITGAGFPG